MTPAQTKAAAAFLLALAEQTRVRIIQKLAAGPKNVTQVATALKLKMVNASHHLNCLRNAGVVDTRKDGRFVVYELVGAAVTTKTVVLSQPGLVVTLDR